jgi:hydrogenase maturation protease
MNKLLLIGLGNEYRRDDGVGLVVVRLIRAHGLPGVTVIESNGDGASLLALWEGAEAVCLVDAVYSGATPGQLYKIDAGVHPLPDKLTAASSHAFGLAQAIEVAQAMKSLPPSLYLYGIEGKEFGMGPGLSPEVERNVPAIVAQIIRQLRGADFDSADRYWTENQSAVSKSAPLSVRPNS